MKIDATQPAARNARVLLDGVELYDCVCADDERGEVWRRTSSRQYTIPQHCYKQTGKVEFHPVTDF